MTDITSDVAPSVNLEVDAGTSAAPNATDARDARIAQLASELANTPEAIRKRRFMKRFHAGRLTLTEYKTLPRDVQPLYRKLHGVPLAANELKRLENYKKRRKERNKCVKKSRRQNRK